MQQIIKYQNGLLNCLYNYLTEQFYYIISYQQLTFSMNCSLSRFFELLFEASST